MVSSMSERVASSRSHSRRASPGRPAAWMGRSPVQNAGAASKSSGLAPGRQVRCGFCNRLLEVPFLPRAADARWKRRRFARPKWFLWACGRARGRCRRDRGHRGLPVRHAAIRFRPAAADQSASRVIQGQRGRRPSRPGLDRSRYGDRNGSKSRPATISPGSIDWGKKRPGLARREAQNAVDRLRAPSRRRFPLGDWLNLIARADKDRDLSPLASSINQQFLAALNREIDSELAAARRSFASGQVLASFNYCERIAATDRASPARQRRRAFEQQTEEPGDPACIHAWSYYRAASRPVRLRSTVVYVLKWCPSS